MNTRPGDRPPPGPPRRKTAPAKAETSLLEPFSGLSSDCILVPAGLEQCAAALASIRAAGVVGFDTETKPVFAKGVIRDGPDIVQFATGSHAFIFQMQRLETRPFLIGILEAEDILKIGFDLRSDLGHLRRSLGVEVKSVLDLTAVFRKRGYRNTTGVRAAVGMVLKRNFRKSKRVTTSNWSLPELSHKQLEYAANDSFAAFQVWVALGRPGLGTRS